MELPRPSEDARAHSERVAARAFIRNLGGSLARGVAFFIDYGFPRQEYCHPQRDGGTLICHNRHRAHDETMKR
jgi:SAM-dependent MidA family methyltransferase